jgi:hypothetical protein
MPTQEEKKNLEVIQEDFTEYWGKGNPEIVDKLCADNFVINYPIPAHDMGKRMPRRCYPNSNRQVGPCKTPNLLADIYINRHFRFTPTNTSCLQARHM